MFKTWEKYHGEKTEYIWPNIKRRAAMRGCNLLEEIADSPISQPIVNHSRWVVMCPFCDGAEYATENELFMCQSCFNEANGFKRIKAPFPKNRKAIEIILGKRPNPKNRNWIGESIDELVKENKEHGVE